MNLPFQFDTRDANRGLQTLRSLLNRPGFLERTTKVRLGGQTWQGFHLGTYRRWDQTTFESWYACGQVNAVALATVAPAIDTLIAVPFVAESAYAWDRLAFNVTAAAAGAGLARVGIYAATVVDGAMYPGELVLEGDEFDVSAVGGAGVKSTTPTNIYYPEEGRLYFAAYLCGTSAPTIRSIPVVGVAPALGVPAALGTAAQIAYTVASTYTPAPVGLPVVFPAAATAHLTPVPAVFLRMFDSGTYTKTYAGDFTEAEGTVLRRASLVATEAWRVNKSGAYFTVSAAVRNGEKSTALDKTYDSRFNELSAGEAFSLTGGQDIDLALGEDDIPEVSVTQYGRPVVDLSGLVVKITTAYVGGET